jgi:hypothetical protein
VRLARCYPGCRTVLRCPAGSRLLAALLAARSVLDPRIKRQAQPWPEPSESVRPFGGTRHSLVSWSGAVRFRASALLLALLLAVGRLSAFQAGHIPSRRECCERDALSPVAAVCRCSLLLLSPLLSAAGAVFRFRPRAPVHAAAPFHSGPGPCAPPLSPIGLTAADSFAGGEVSRADSRVR